MKADLEREFLAHFTTVQSMRLMFEEGVKDYFFSDETAQEMYLRAMDYYIKSGLRQAIPRPMLEEDFAAWITQRGWPEEPYVLSVLIARLKEKYRRVRMQDAIRLISSVVMEDPEEAVSMGATEFAKIQFDTATRDRFEVYSEGFDQRIELYTEEVLGRERNRGYPIGWEEVTEETYGIRPKELGVIVGFTGVGKSWCLAKMALTAAEAGARVYYCSLENAKDLTLARLDCLVAGVSYRDYDRGRLGPEEMNRLTSARERIAAFGDRLVVDSPLRRSERSTAELYSRARYFGAEYFVGDQLSWVTPEGKYPDRSTEMASVINDISEVNKELGMASMWAAQFNRESMRARKGRGGLQHIALSSAIEQIVDWAFSLSAGPDHADENMMLFEIMKARRNRPKGWLLNWRLDGVTDLSVLREYEESDA